MLLARLYDDPVFRKATSRLLAVARDWTWAFLLIAKYTSRLNLLDFLVEAKPLSMLRAETF